VIPERGGCREWRGAHTMKGYGKRKIAGQQWLVHRWVWTQMHGPIPEGLNVLHHCDNPPCYLLDHLFLGTTQDNHDDMVAKGRAVTPPIVRHYGEANGMTTLTIAQVAEIRAALAAGEVQRRIAERYGVAPATITRIKRGKVWRGPQI
jgi:HNH endonuclease